VKSVFASLVPEGFIYNIEPRGGIVICGFAEMMTRSNITRTLTVLSPDRCRECRFARTGAFRTAREAAQVRQGAPKEYARTAIVNAFFPHRAQLRAPRFYSP
jgi:hypothetical protein